MPYPEGHKLKVRGRIIESAAKAIRASGVQGISVPFIMKGAGLTHGGFYSHFDNKEQLVAETCRFAISETIALLQKAADQEKEAPKIHAVIHYYLSPQHRDQTDVGCILPALSAEVSRMSEELRQIFTEELQRMIDFITDLAEVDPLTGQALLSLMVGTIVLSRSVSDAELSDRLLSTGRQHAKDLIKTSSQS